MTPSTNSPDREPSRTPARPCRPGPAWRAARRPAVRRETAPSGPVAAGHPPREMPAGPPRGAAAGYAPREAAPGGRPPRETPPAHGADPVKTLIHRHRRLCAYAVDPLEIAAGLEAHGVTDRTAHRFRHRDVFSLAEELYARVPRARVAAAPLPEPAGRGAAVRAVLPLLPGALCAATLAAVAAVHPGHPQARPATAAAGAVLILLALRLCLSAGPPRGRRAGRPYAAVLTVGWLVGHALLGGTPVAVLLSGRPGLPHLDAAVALALTCGTAPAAGLARWFARRARRGLAVSRGLGELASRVRPLLLGVALLYAAAQLVLLLGARRLTGGPADPPAVLVAVTALGTLLFLARLLAVHGFPAAALAGPAVAAAGEFLALALTLAAWLPDTRALGRPVDALTAAGGPAAVPAVICAATAAGLLAYALRALAGARAHLAPGQPEAARP